MRRLSRNATSLSTSSSLIPVHDNFGLSALNTRIHSFCSGLDEGRMLRLRNSGTSRTPPRGRTETSMAFESRIDLRPMTSVGDLYKDATPGSVVVLPVAGKGEVDASVVLPASSPFPYDEKNGSLFCAVTPSPSTPTDENHDGDTAYSALQFTAPFKRFLRRDGDTHRCVLNDIAPTTTTSHSQDRAEDRQRLLVAVVDPNLDTKVYHDTTETQIELITAYRNILLEAAEWAIERSRSRSQQAAANTHHTTVVQHPLVPSIGVLRMPVLALDSVHPNVIQHLPKLTQISVIKAFHRIAEPYKEALIAAGNHAPLGSRSQREGSFRVELYVPAELLPTYQQTFLTEAWPMPTSIYFPSGKLEVYSKLPPPEQMLMFDGWVGKRPELIEAVKTQGENLESDVLFSLDGAPITQLDALHQIDTFSGRGKKLDLVKREQEYFENQQQQLQLPDVVEEGSTATRDDSDGNKATHATAA